MLTTIDNLPDYVFGVRASREADKSDLESVLLPGLKKLADRYAEIYSGSIAWQKDTSSLHVHGVVTDSSFKAWDGYLLSARVITGSLEITVIVDDKKKLERKMEEPPGAIVL